MFEQLKEVKERLEEIVRLLSDADTAKDPARLQSLMKEQAGLLPVAQAYNSWQKVQETIQDCQEMLSGEKDEDMRSLLKEELSGAKDRMEELEQELRIMLLPKDPNDEKNVVVEIRAGVGGDEAALFASQVYRMYLRYAETHGWKVELTSVSENGIGGFKECVFLVNGKGAYSRLKYESGVHRVQRVPETESGGRIHTSACTVAIDGQEVTVTQQNDTQAGSFHMSSDSAGKQSIDPVPSQVLHHPEVKCLYFTVRTEKPVHMILKVRIPDWTEAEAADDGYCTFDRVWHSGDSVCVRLPMRIRAEYLPDDDHMAAFTYGPITLAGQTDAETMLDLHGKPAEESIARESERQWASWTEQFKTVGQERGTRLLPLYKIGYEPYEVYFPVKNKPGD